MYPRRLLAFFTKYVTKKRLNHQEIRIPSNKLKFLREVLSINYIPSSKDIKAINQQIQAFAECLTTINYSNYNDKTRKNRVDFNFFASDVSFLWDDTKEWQHSITLSNDFFELIKSNAVPVSELVTTTNRNALKVDVINYLLYQNYNLQRKDLQYRFQFIDLQQLFAANLQFFEFKTFIKQLLKDLESTANLNVGETDKNSFVLIGSQDAVLFRPLRRKTNPDQDAPIKISAEKLSQLEKQYNQIEVLSAMQYMDSIQKNGNDIRNPLAYIKDVLKNPHWYRKQKVKAIDLIHEKQYSQFAKLESSKRKILYDELVNRIKITPLYKVSHDLELILSQFKNPGQQLIKIPRFEYCVYLYWVNLTDQLKDTNNTHNERLIFKLFTELMH